MRILVLIIIVLDSICLKPVILIPGMAGSQLYAKLDKPKS